MTIFAKASGIWKEIADVYTKSGSGWTQTSEVYSNENPWVQVYPDTQPLVMLSAEDVALDQWLDENGARAGYHIVVTIPIHEVIGGTAGGGYAITAGDISIYKSVTLIVEGSIQGQGGVHNGYKTGSHGIHTSYPLTVQVASSGNILAGGGAGGRGGQGGTGHWVWDTGWGDNPSTGTGSNIPPWEENYQPTEGASKNASFWQVNGLIRWKNAAMGDVRTYAYNIRSNTIQTNATNFPQSTFVYTKGSNKSGSKEAIRRAPLNILVGGDGGRGGNGQGYRNNSVGSVGGSAATSTKSGAATTPSVAYGGSGGSGGRGGLWGKSGTGGTGGTSGTKFQAKGRVGPNSAGHESGNKVTHSYTQAGAAGANAAGPGKAIRGSGLLTLTNEGSIVGVIDNPTA